MKTLKLRRERPVAVFVMTGRCLGGQKLGVSSLTCSSPGRINDDKPFDQLVDELEQIVLDMAQEREE